MLPPRCSTPLVVVLLVHAACDGALLVHPWPLRTELLIVAFALPVSQNALVAIWASTHHSASYIRCVLLSLGLVVTWYVATAIVPARITSESAAGWSTAFVVQSLVIVLIVTTARRFLPISSDSRDRKGGPTSRGYSLSTMLLWVAALTVPLLLIRLSVTQLGWTARVFQWEFFPHMMVTGAYNGLYAAVVFMSTAWRGRVWRWFAAAGVLILLGVSEVPLLSLAFSDAGMEAGEAMLFAGTQVFILCATLVPLQVVGRRSTQELRRRLSTQAPPRRIPAEEVNVRAKTTRRL